MRFGRTGSRRGKKVSQVSFSTHSSLGSYTVTTVRGVLPAQHQDPPPTHSARPTQDRGSPSPPRPPEWTRRPPPPPQPPQPPSDHPPPLPPTNPPNLSYQHPLPNPSTIPIKHHGAHPCCAQAYRTGTSSPSSPMAPCSSRSRSGPKDTEDCKQSLRRCRSRYAEPGAA